MKHSAAEASSDTSAFEPLTEKLTLVSRIREGFSFDELEKSISGLGLKPTDLCDFGIIAPRTLSHAKRAGQLSSAQSDRVAGFIYLYTAAAQTFGSTESARHWLERPTKALNNRAPVQLLDTQIGSRLVEDLLKRIDYGLAT